MVIIFWHEAKVLEGMVENFQDLVLAVKDMGGTYLGNIFSTISGKWGVICFLWSKIWRKYFQD